MATENNGDFVHSELAYAEVPRGSEAERIIFMNAYEETLGLTSLGLPLPIGSQVPNMEDVKLYERFTEFNRAMKNLEQTGRPTDYLVKEITATLRSLEEFRMDLDANFVEENRDDPEVIHDYANGVLHKRRHVLSRNIGRSIDAILNRI